MISDNFCCEGRGGVRAERCDSAYFALISIFRVSRLYLIDFAVHRSRQRRVSQVSHRLSGGFCYFLATTFFSVPPIRKSILG